MLLKHSFGIALANVSYVVLAMVIAAVGCRQQTQTNKSSQLSTQQSTKTEAESEMPSSAKSDESSIGQLSAAAEKGQAATNEHADVGRGMMGRGRGMGRGPGAMGGMREDMTTLHAMFSSRDKIKRTTKNLPDGAEAVTSSDDEEIVRLIQEHVPAMERRVLNNEPLPPMTFHPIFVDLIKHSDEYTLTYEDTDKGIKVTYASEDPYVVMLVQEHAKLVSRFINNGMEEIHKPYALPKLDTRPINEGAAARTGLSKSPETENVSNEGNRE